MSHEYFECSATIRGLESVRDWEVQRLRDTGHIGSSVRRSRDTDHSAAGDTIYEAVFVATAAQVAVVGDYWIDDQRLGVIIFANHERHVIVACDLKTSR